MELLPDQQNGKLTAILVLVWIVYGLVDGQQLAGWQRAGAE